MFELVSQYRGPINLLLVFIVACFVLVRAISWASRCLHAAAAHSEVASQHPVLRAIDSAATIGLGIAWTALIYTGPSLAQLSQGQGRASHWLAVLAYMWLWLAVLPSVQAKDEAAVLTSVALRTVLYGLFLAAAIVNLNDW